MAGQEVFKHAVVKLAETGAAALARAGLTTADVDWLVPHQANLRIMTMTAHKLGVPMERVVVTVQDHGNTSAASIPLALSVAHAEGRILPGRRAADGGDRRRPRLGRRGGALVGAAFARAPKPLLLTRFRNCP